MVALPFSARARNHPFSAPISTPPPGRSWKSRTSPVWPVPAGVKVALPFSARARNNPFSARISTMAPGRSWIVNTLFPCLRFRRA